MNIIPSFYNDKNMQTEISKRQINTFAVCIFQTFTWCLALPAQTYAQGSFFSELLKDQLSNILTCPTESNITLDMNTMFNQIQEGSFIPLIPPPPDMLIDSIRDLSPSARDLYQTDILLAGIDEYTSLIQIAYDSYELELSTELIAERMIEPELRLEGIIKTVFDDTGTEISNQSTIGFLATSLNNPEEHFVVFRGTLNSQEWINNLVASQSNFISQDGDSVFKVHTGFYTIYQSLEITTSDGLSLNFQDLIKTTFEDHHIKFIGHSLGGALSTLAALDRASALPDFAKRLELITYGSPRVTDSSAALLNQSLGRSIRICNIVDMVPTVPASISDSEYTHLGNSLAVSSFDFSSTINNDIDDYSTQFSCWHNISAYRVMLGLEPDDPQSQCFNDY